MEFLRRYECLHIQDDRLHLARFATMPYFIVFGGDIDRFATGFLWLNDFATQNGVIIQQNKVF